MYKSCVFGLIFLVCCLNLIEIPGSSAIEDAEIHEIENHRSSGNFRQVINGNDKPQVVSFRRRRRTTTPVPRLPPQFDSIPMPPGAGIYRPAPGVPYPLPPGSPGSGSGSDTGSGTTTTTTTSTGSGSGTGTMGRKKK